MGLEATECSQSYAKGLEATECSQSYAKTMVHDERGAYHGHYANPHRDLHGSHRRCWPKN